MRPSPAVCTSALQTGCQSLSPCSNNGLPQHRSARASSLIRPAKPSNSWFTTPPKRCRGLSSSSSARGQRRASKPGLPRVIARSGSAAIARCGSSIESVSEVRVLRSDCPEALSEVADLLFKVLRVLPQSSGGADPSFPIQIRCQGAAFSRSAWEGTATLIR